MPIFWLEKKKQEQVKKPDEKKVEQPKEEAKEKKS